MIETPGGNRGKGDRGPILNTARRIAQIAAFLGALSGPAQAFKSPAFINAPRPGVSDTLPEGEISATSSEFDEMLLARFNGTEQFVELRKQAANVGEIPNPPEKTYALFLQPKLIEVAGRLAEIQAKYEVVPSIPPDGVDDPHASERVAIVNEWFKVLAEFEATADAQRNLEFPEGFSVDELRARAVSKFPGLVNGRIPGLVDQ